MNGIIILDIFHAGGRKIFFKELEMEDGEAMDNIVAIWEEILHYFESLFTRPQKQLQWLEGLEWDPIIQESARNLELVFSKEVVLKATII